MITSKPLILICFLLLSAVSCFTQTLPPGYQKLVKKADGFYRAKNYKNSALTYTQALRSAGWKGSVNDHYNAACSWAMAGVPDSAFARLHHMIVYYKYSDLAQLTEEPDLVSLHRDKRWKKIPASIQQNIDRREARLNKPLIKLLAVVHDNDQRYRDMMDSVHKNFGSDSKELKLLFKNMHVNDSLDLMIVKSIIDTAGWLGPDVVGEEGNETLFLVIQHADPATQQKYLPVMRAAVKNGNADASALALLEDRVLLGLGKKQVYGSQVLRDPKTETFMLAPIEDEKNVDKRRASMGLEPIADYVKKWGIDYQTKGPEAAKRETTVAVAVSNDPELAITIRDSVAGPFNICTGFGKTMDYAYRNGIGVVPNTGIREENSTWFKLQFDRDTTLVFDLVPRDFKDDYDFAIFRCTTGDCIKEIRSGKLAAERVCYSINELKNGATGLSEFATQNVIGAGPASGYVATMKVLRGEPYYLMVNYAENYFKYYKRAFPKGFMIYFYNYWPGKPEYLKHPPKNKPPKNMPVVLENIFFETDRAVIQKASFVSLDKLVAQLAGNKKMEIEISGHTDNSGDEEHNQELSEQRAAAVMQYLVSKNINKERLTFKGYGSKKPVTTNDTEEGRSKNRRVEFIVTKQ